MPSFLSLPRELRDNIYRKILDIQTNPEPEPSAPKGLTSLKIDDPEERKKRPSNRTRIGRPSEKKRVDSGILQNAVDVSANGATSGNKVDGETQTETAELCFDGMGMEVEPEYYDGEESVRYPKRTPTTNVSGLLQSSQQLRAEVLDAVSRSRMRYRIVISYRDDNGRVYPTWVNLPAFASAIDELDVDMRLRPSRSSTLCSANWDDDGDDGEGTGSKYDGDLAYGTISLLQRFLERGAHFLDRKRRRPLRIGHLRVSWRVVNPQQSGTNVSPESADDMQRFFDEWFAGEYEDGFLAKSQRREDEFIIWLAERIGKFSLSMAVGRGETAHVRSRSWNLPEATAKRRARLEKMRGDPEYERLHSETDY